MENNVDELSWFIFKVVTTGFAYYVEMSKQMKGTTVPTHKPLSPKSLIFIVLKLMVVALFNV